VILLACSMVGSLLLLPLVLLLLLLERVCLEFVRGARVEGGWWRVNTPAGGITSGGRGGAAPWTPGPDGGPRRCRSGERDREIGCWFGCTRMCSFSPCARTD
jgi:hypothetical protein